MQQSVRKKIPGKMVMSALERHTLRHDQNK
jgi:hypothetical protein